MGPRVARTPVSGPALTVDSTIFELWVVLRASKTQQLNPDGKIGVRTSKFHT